ncbi:MAG TPA: hypothetical protein DHV16_01965 [Nitrospiraceae bacterium]|nr:MAG: hypothetical protein A2Z82_10740 [Nitrospirae bacterium GWA2_46_11]OGW22781.1 MAG: hypothetical protein A2X55_02545 [Nitrospirae bacterium GWB2_47_37]HAK89793.1 hypothetical protein [Nitrospiraceae bacterium]HCZ11028.1 hypothetical protein [Nitrospiraceae bacterium]
MKNLKSRRFLLLFMVCCLLFVVYGCSGYAIQTKANLPFDTIAVGKIENKTLEPKLQDRFIRSLAETFAEYGFSVSRSAKYKLEGKITKFELLPLNEQNLVATQYQVIVKASFNLVDTSTGRSVPLVADNPFITYFSTSARLEDVLAQKDISTNGALKNIAQEVARAISYNTPKNFAYLMLAATDIKDIDSLKSKMRDPKDPVSLYIRERLSPDTRQLLSGDSVSKEASDKAKNALVGGLNEILQGVGIYDENRFAHIMLSRDVKELIKKNPSGIERLRLNRLLLEAAYPGEILKHQDASEEAKK